MWWIIGGLVAVALLSAWLLGRETVRALNEQQRQDDDMEAGL